MATASSRYAKRTSKAIYRKFDSLLADMLAMRDIYQDDHPELADAIDTAGHGIMMAQELWIAFHAACWGSIPSDWSSDV